jgi:hypothetical protein
VISINSKQHKHWKETNPEAYAKWRKNLLKRKNINYFKKGFDKRRTGFQKGHTFNNGRKFTEEHKQRIANSRKGEKNPNWKGGMTKSYQTGYQTREYKQWRMAVFLRDNFTCQFCGIRGTYLEAHHIKQWAYHPDLRFDINNGVTLCYDCHQLTKTKKWREQNGRRD